MHAHGERWGGPAGRARFPPAPARRRSVAILLARRPARPPALFPSCTLAPQCEFKNVFGNMCVRGRWRWCGCWMRAPPLCTTRGIPRRCGCCRRAHRPVRASPRAPAAGGTAARAAKRTCATRTARSASFTTVSGWVCASPRLCAKARRCWVPARAGSPRPACADLGCLLHPPLPPLCQTTTTSAASPSASSRAPSRPWQTPPGAGGARAGLPGGRGCSGERGVSLGFCTPQRKLWPCGPCSSGSQEAGRRGGGGRAAAGQQAPAVG